MTGREKEIGGKRGEKGGGSQKKSAPSPPARRTRSGKSAGVIPPKRLSASADSVAGIAWVGLLGRGREGRCSTTSLRLLLRRFSIFVVFVARLFHSEEQAGDKMLPARSAGHASLPTSHASRRDSRTCLRFATTTLPKEDRTLLERNPSARGSERHCHAHTRAGETS